MGQSATKPRPSVENSSASLPRDDSHGLVPRNSAARKSCSVKRVKSLIRRGRLAPCWTLLREGEGCECPICLELYRKLNLTACCHQPLCTECFINVVAPSGGMEARCPYCQRTPLQVYLLPPDSSEGAEAAAAVAAESDTLEDGSSHSSTGLQPVAEDEEAAAVLATMGPKGGSRALSRAASDSLDAYNCDVNSRLCTSAAPLPLAVRVRLLAEAAAAAAQQQGPAVVGMVLEDGSSQAPTSQPQDRTAAAATHAPTEAAAAPAEAAVAGSDAPTGVAGLATPEGGPALLLNPDGTEQLVLALLSSKTTTDEEDAGQQGGEHLGDESGLLATYQAPTATPEDERMRQAIACADAALLRRPIAEAAAAPRPRQPTSSEGSGVTGAQWLERMRQADAALRAAVARNDQQHFGEGGSASGAGA